MTSWALSPCQIEEIRKAYAEGATGEELAEKYGVTSRTIYRHTRGIRKPGQVTRVSAVYPNLAAWMKANNVHVGEFAIRCGCSITVASMVLRGESRPSKRMIDAVLNATGMSYEQAFATEKADIL